MRSRSLHFLALFAPAALADVPPDWVTTHSSGDEITFAGLAVAPSGASYVVATREFGNDDQMVTLHFDAGGTLVWERVYAGPGGFDLGVDVVLAADGSVVYAVGRSSVPGSSSDYNVVQYDATSGAPIWQRTFDGPASGIDDPRDAAALPGGGVVVTGKVWNGDERFDYGTVAFDAAGNELWSVVYGENGPFLFNEDGGELVVVTPGGDVIVTGEARPANSGNDVVTFRYDGATGAQEWVARYSTSADERSEDLALTPDGDVVLLANDPFGLDRRWVVARYDGASGATVWQTLYDAGFDEAPNGVAVDAAGDVYATGSTDPDSDDGNNNQNMILLALDGADGSVRWLLEFGGEDFNERDGGADLAVVGGRVDVVGHSASKSVSGDTLNTDAVLWRVAAADGALLDTGVVDTTVGMIVDDHFLGLGVDAGGGVVTGGLAITDPIARDLIVAAFPGDGPKGAVYCDETQNANNAADISIDKLDSGAAAIHLTLTNGPPNQFAYLLVGDGSATVSQPPGAKGDLCVAGGSCLGRYAQDIGVIDALGVFSIDIQNALSNPCAGAVNLDPGATWNFQFWHRQPMGQPSSFSSALSVTFE